MLNRHDLSSYLRCLLVKPRYVELFTRQKGNDLTNILWREADQLKQRKGGREGGGYLSCFL